MTLEISDAAEGVEVFLNGQSAGIQIVPPYRYDISRLAVEGTNHLLIEVATTLERQCFDLTKDNPRMKMRGLQEPRSSSGIAGAVKLFQQKTGGA